MGSGVSCRGNGAGSVAHTGHLQSRRQPALQASRPSPMLRAASTATAPASRGTTVAAGRMWRGGESPDLSCPPPTPAPRAVTCGVGGLVEAMAGDPVSRRPGGGSQLAEAA